MEEFKPGCQRPAIQKPRQVQENGSKEEVVVKEERMSMIQVGKPAPKFTAPAYFNGKFVNVSLEEFKGKWVVLCFYPGDFTFV